MRQAFGALSVVIAAIVFAHYAFSTFYPDTVDTDMVWVYADLLIMAGLVIGLVAHYRRLRKAHAEGAHAPVTRAYLEATVLFFLTALVAIVFAWNWLDDLQGGFSTAQSDTRYIFWAAIDPVFILLTATTGVQLWRER